MDLGVAVYLESVAIYVILQCVIYVLVLIMCFNIKVDHDNGLMCIIY